MDAKAKPLTKRQKWEARKEKRGQIERCYREHTPPQVRHLRWLKKHGLLK